LHPAIDALIPDFEKSSGHEVTVAYGNAGAIADRFQKGEAADLMINAAPLMDRLRAQGNVVAGDRIIIIAKVGVSAFVRKGAAKPDLSSADAFKRSMLAARSIAYPDPAGGGASGIYVASLLERLGIAVEMKPKTKLFPPTEVLYGSVASGEVEIGFNQITMAHLGKLPETQTTGQGAEKAKVQQARQQQQRKADAGIKPVLGAVKFPSSDGFEITSA